MKFKKILSGVLASAMLISAMPTFSSFAASVSGGNNVLDPFIVDFDEVMSGSMDESQDNWYKLSLPSAGKVTVSVAITYLEYSGRKPSYSFISGGNSTITLDSAVDLSGTNVFTYYLTAGDYYVKLNTSEYYSSMSYNMQVKFTPSDVTFDSVDNNTIAKAVAVDYDGTVYSGQLSLNDSVDYYTFDVAEQGRVTLNFDSPMEDVDWEIYDSENDCIKTGYFSKGNHDSGISAREANIMKPGKYTIAFKKKYSYGDYSFSLDYLQNYNDLSVSGIIAAADLNEDGKVDASDASLILVYYAYLSTGGTELDMNKWLADRLNK